MNGFFVFVLAVTIFGAVVLIPRALAHDRLLFELEHLDDEALAEALERGAL
jgi:hypothetical protein